MVPIPPGLQSGPGGTLMRLAAAGLESPHPEINASLVREIEVEETDPFTQRALRSEDFVRVPTAAAKKE